MSTNVQNLRELKRWNLFWFDGYKYVSQFPFAGTWDEMMSFRMAWPYSLSDVSTVILPYGCSF